MKSTIPGLAGGAGIAAAGFLAWSVGLAPQAAAQTDGSDAWVHPTTPWGDPDLRGRWPIHHMTETPLERPERFGERAFLNDEELAERRAEINDRNTAYEEENEQNKIGMGHWAEAGQIPQRQASLIVDPPDGRLPELTEAGQRKSDRMRSSWMDIPFDSPADFDSWDRCVTRGMPASMFPMQYNNGIQILQAPGYVVIRLEMIHETRIVPVDEQPPLPEEVRRWMGEPRGHWEGDTLVVETTNFNGKTPMTSVVTPGSPPQNDVPTSEAMRIVERFTRTGEDTIDYEITTEDPRMMTQPWTVAYQWQRDPSYEFFEYACHEGNETLRNYITTSRYERAQQNGSAAGD